MLIVCARFCVAQPYLDLVNVRYVNSPEAGFINHEKNRLRLQYFNASATLPFQFNKKKDAVIISPYFESWILDMQYPYQKTTREKYYGLILPVSFLKTINDKWSLLSTIITRINDSKINAESRGQLGGALIAGYKRKPNLTWKFGCYVNGDYFGLFVMPLLGIDWRINSTTNLFGVLPGSLILEKKLHTRLYTGASFKAITNSFGKKESDLYWRIDENLVGAFVDFHITPMIAFTLEGGHTILRKVRQTNYGIFGPERFDRRANDNLWGKVSLAYRVRL